jgi:hypothetical protein
MAREKFCDVVRRALHDRQESQSMFAQRLGVTSPTLRTWLHRNCFPKLAVQKINKELNFQIEDDYIDKKYDFAWARPTLLSGLYKEGSLRSAFITADRECERIASAMAPMSDMVVNLCARMGEQDLLIVLTATVTPWEMERHVGAEMREAIIRGVQRGGTYLYLRARQSLIDAYHDRQFDRMPAQDKCEAEIKVFRELIAERLQAAGIPKVEAEDRAARATPQYYVEDNLPFLVPGFVIMMFRAGGHPGNEEDRLVVRIPDNAWATVYLTKAVYFHDRFRRTIHKALEDEEKSLPKRAETLENLKGHALKVEKSKLARDQEILNDLLSMMKS